MTELTGARLIGVGAAVPETVVTNADIAKMVDTSDEWIQSRTGIRSRRVVLPGQTGADLGTKAALDALAYAGIDPKQIDLVIVATSTPDYFYPATACFIQHAIGAENAAAFDLEAACTGMIYALVTGYQFVATGTYKNVLVVGVDVHSRFLDWTDRNTCILFGDGAGAFVIQASDTDNEILSSYLRSDGSRTELLYLLNPGTNYPVGRGVEHDPTRVVKMNGRSVYEFAVKAVPEAILAACSKAGIKIEDVDYFIPHQANDRITKAAAARLDAPQEKWISDVDQHGNTSAASIPLAFRNALARGQIKLPATCVMVGFGAGLTWAAIVVRWTAEDKRK
jgi:3-oxoacyl-[acyl-carrier-protein] synthase III